MTFVSFAILVASYSSASQQGTALVDQVNLESYKPDSYGALVWQNPTFLLQQEIVAGISGKLAGIDLYPASLETAFILSVNQGIGWQTDENALVVGVQSTVANRASPITNPQYIDLSAANLLLSAGDTFVIGVTGDPEVNRGSLRGTTYDPIERAHYIEPGTYSAGRLFIDVSQICEPRDPRLWGLDLAFRTYILPIPEPSTLLLAALTACGMLVRRRR